MRTPLERLRDKMTGQDFAGGSRSIILNADEAAAFAELDAVGESSDEVASIAGRGLRDPASLTPDEIERVCASVVGQARRK